MRIIRIKEKLRKELEEKYKEEFKKIQILYNSTLYKKQELLKTKEADI